MEQYVPVCEPDIQQPWCSDSTLWDKDSPWQSFGRTFSIDTHRLSESSNQNFSQSFACIRWRVCPLTRHRMLQSIHCGQREELVVAVHLDVQKIIDQNQVHFLPQRLLISFARTPSSSGWQRPMIDRRSFLLVRMQKPERSRRSLKTGRRYFHHYPCIFRRQPDRSHAFLAPHRSTAR